MSAIIIKSISLALLIGLLGVAAFIYAPGGHERLDHLFKVPALSPTNFATLKKNQKPNQYLVLPKGFGSERPDLIAPTFKISALKAAELWRHQIAVGPLVTERSWDTSSLQGEYVERTPRMHYPDLISVQFIPLTDTTCTIAIYSRSVYGRKDFGVNKKRITLWLNRLNTLAVSSGDSA